MSAWGWSQWWVIGTTALSVVIHVSKHGKPRDGYDGPVAFIAACVFIWILWMGGFFS